MLESLEGPVDQRDPSRIRVLRPLSHPGLAALHIPVRATCRTGIVGDRTRMTEAKTFSLDAS